MARTQEVIIGVRGQFRKPDLKNLTQLSDVINRLKTLALSDQAPRIDPGRIGDSG